MAAQPDTKTSEIGLAEAREFLSANDEDKVSELMGAEMMNLYVHRIRLEKARDGPKYKIFMAPIDEAARELIKRDESKDGIEPYVSGSVDYEAYKEFEGDSQE